MSCSYYMYCGLEAAVGTGACLIVVEKESEVLRERLVSWVPARFPAGPHGGDGVALGTGRFPDGQQGEVQRIWPHCWKDDETIHEPWEDGQDTAGFCALGKTGLASLSLLLQVTF